MGRALILLDAILADEARSNTVAIAATCALPIATAHRFVATFVEQRYLTRVGRGRHVAGPSLRQMASRVYPLQGIAALARPFLEELAREVQCVSHLGIFENDMITYLVKAGGTRNHLFTQEGMQLEAYCSGIGKILLANLSVSERESYLANGPFIALTPHTLTDPQHLRDELVRVQAQRFAIDNREVSADLICVAAPIHWPDGRVHAAISVSNSDIERNPKTTAQLIPLVQSTARRLEGALFGDQE